MFLAQQPDIGARDRSGQRAACARVGDQHNLVRERISTFRAMKCTPAWTITLAFVPRGPRASAKLSPVEVAHAVEDFAVVM